MYKGVKSSGRGGVGVHSLNWSLMSVLYQRGKKKKKIGGNFLLLLTKFSNISLSAPVT